MSSRRIITAVAVVAAAAMLAGCGGKTEKAAGGSGATRLTVGFSQVGAESSWRVAETASIKEEAGKRGVDLKFADAQGDQAKQIQAVTGFIAQGVDAIILAPKVETGWDQVLAKAKAHGIPVILVDRGVKVGDDSLYCTLIASDFVYEGRAAGEWLASHMKGSAKIAQLEGSPGAAPAIDRKRGFEEAIAAHAGMEIVASQSGDFNKSRGKEVMESLLKAHADINAVYAHNDDMALGAIQAIEEAGMTAGKDIVVVSIDGVKSALQAIVDGKLGCSVECSPLMGPMAFDAVEKALAGEPLSKRTVVQDRTYDSAGVDQALVDRRPY